jgi:hypothetical protein
MRLSDRVLAGTIAGYLFQAEAWLSVGCALILLGTQFRLPEASTLHRRRVNQLVMAMLGCTLVGYFALHPWMAALRDAAGPGGIAASPDRITFGILHGVSSGFYFVKSLFAVFLVLKISEPA